MQEKITIERLTYGDAGVGRAASGKTVFVNGVVPGDVVSVEVTADKGNYLEATLNEVLTPSPDRVVPACPLADMCGGCGWQQVSYERQIAEKRDNVVSQLQRVGGVEPERAQKLVAACVPSKKQMGYRNKLEFSCADVPGKGFMMGYHRKGSEEIIAPDTCPLAHKAIQRVPKAVRGALRYLNSRGDLGIYRVGIRHSARTGDLEIALWTNPSGFPRAMVAKTLEQATKATGVVRVMTSDTGKAPTTTWPTYIAAWARSHCPWRARPRWCSPWKATAQVCATCAARARRRTWTTSRSSAAMRHASCRSWASSMRCWLTLPARASQPRLSAALRKLAPRAWRT